ncbi:MAG: HAMP domain-containing histidine kinase [Helicobacteraceae bacterium]|nr:HAMP domain-containing histidine kinase [Helicobacteraceae bacterium]
MELQLSDDELLQEIERRFATKNALSKEMEFMTKKLLSLNEQAKQTESVKDSFLSLIKNTFHDPLNSLLNLAHILATRKNSDQFNNIVDMLNAELLRLDFQLKNIFETLSIEEGKIENDYSIIHFMDIFQDASLTFKYIMAERHITASLVRSEDKDFISDAHKIYMILLNLLSNACEYAFEDSNIEVNLRRVDGGFEISVQDTGVAIDVKFHPQVFTRFANRAKGTAKKREGLGLGLSVVRGLTESLDGNVDYESKDNTTKFTVFLPLVPQESAESMAVGDNEFFFDGGVVEL